LNVAQVFPQNLSARQFRLAFKSLVQIVTPPSPLASNQPLLASTLLELVHDRAHHASSTVLPPSQQVPAGQEGDIDDSAFLSEQAALTLALIDSLSFLRVDDLEEWLPLTAELINSIRDSRMRTTCVERFWDALSGGEMDVERADFCVTWWSTRGGRELVLFGEQQPPQGEAVMSGALGAVGAESKL
jgi:hypothetical protein